LAWELSQRLRGARVRDVGRLPDGRVALALWRRGRNELLCIDIFGSPPVVTVEEGDLPIDVEPGFVRLAGAALRGTTLTAVLSRSYDRLLRLEFASRSRFGVEERLSLVCELVPRFGNVILLKNDTVVAACKEFALAENAVRAVEAGRPYQPPPMRPGNSSPLLRADQVERLAAEPPGGDLYVYRHEGRLLAAHLAPLERFGETPERSASLLDLFVELRAQRASSQRDDRLSAQRRKLARALDDREKRLRAELLQIERKLREAEGRQALRAQGEGVFATLHELPPEQRAEAKDRAAKLFARYKKAAASLAHLQLRKTDLQAAVEDLVHVRWELDRADDAELADVAAAVAALEPRRSGPSAAAPKARRRTPLRYETASGSRIYVGRTPVENADLTFRVARPGDLWFHVQNQPGAHVILQRDDRAAPPDEDIYTAASLAALHSKAKNSPKVTVDYTQRKHVRKRPGAAPGLVFYTHPRSVQVAPQTPGQQPTAPEEP
jgi:predicted ribosome quality control (RQC) complex YloA/Tae2 family protein